MPPCYPHRWRWPKNFHLVILPTCFYLWLLSNFFLRRLKLEFCLIVIIAHNREETQVYSQHKKLSPFIFSSCFCYLSFSNTCMSKSLLTLFSLKCLMNVWVWVYFSMALVQCSLWYIGLSSLEMSIHMICFFNHLLWNIDFY